MSAYGIAIGEMAGIRKSVTNEARRILKKVEHEKSASRKNGGKQSNLEVALIIKERVSLAKDDAMQKEDVIKMLFELKKAIVKE